MLFTIKLNLKKSLATYALWLSVALVVVAGFNSGLVHSYPGASVGLYSHVNKLSDKMKLNSNKGSLNTDDRESFQQFIQSKPESTIIGEFKPNSSELEMMLLKNKIANTISSMQEMEKNAADVAQSAALTSGDQLVDGSSAECFIETTKVERIPGKCHKVNQGLPICQSENYMAINRDCK